MSFGNHKNKEQQQGFRAHKELCNKVHSCNSRPPRLSTTQTSQKQEPQQPINYNNMVYMLHANIELRNTRKNPEKFKKLKKPRRGLAMCKVSWMCGSCLYKGGLPP